jgi:hypothetical protein
MEDQCPIPVTEVLAIDESALWQYLCVNMAIRRNLNVSFDPKNDAVVPYGFGNIHVQERGMVPVREIFVERKRVWIVTVGGMEYLVPPFRMKYDGTAIWKNDRSTEAYPNPPRASVETILRKVIDENVFFHGSFQLVMLRDPVKYEFGVSAVPIGRITVGTISEVEIPN